MLTRRILHTIARIPSASRGVAPAAAVPEATPAPDAPARRPNTTERSPRQSPPAGKGPGHAWPHRR